MTIFHGIFFFSRNASRRRRGAHAVQIGLFMPDHENAGGFGHKLAQDIGHDRDLTLVFFSSFDRPPVEFEWNRF